MNGISRRGFFKVVAGGSALALAPKKSAFGMAEFDGYPESMGVLVDLTRCIGCRTCEAACNREHGLPEPDLPFNDLSVFDQTFHGGTQKRRTDDGAFTVVNRYDTKTAGGPVYRKIQCNHCKEPACLTSCFVSAYKKTKEGAVIYNPDVCVGCRMCMVACPFGIPAYSYDSALHPEVIKCNFCYDNRLKHGKPPACVEACPQEALTFGHRNTLVKTAHERIRANPEKYVDHVYGETEVGGTSWMYLSGVPFDQLGFNTSLQHHPILDNTKSFLGIVPMVLGIWPAMFMGFHLLATGGKKEEENKKSQHRGEVHEE
ncbi:MAG: 4Fe-4S dicluster domain-containing protein [Deltaproteobacteria bacterium]|nr:4Fe-4S dicluster domain-containing protein [Candidatus Anaeroferrophillus wilburensis]MBN2889791.1 4Fe-4S dicluster domain-containing protein [Deltaproteobacteria bacterium]